MSYSFIQFPSLYVSSYDSLLRKFNTKMLLFVLTRSLVDCRLLIYEFMILYLYGTSRNSDLTNKSCSHRNTHKYVHIQRERDLKWNIGLMNNVNRLFKIFITVQKIVEARSTYGKVLFNCYGCRFQLGTENISRYHSSLKFCRFYPILPNECHDSSSIKVVAPNINNKSLLQSLVESGEYPSVFACIVYG